MIKFFFKHKSKKKNEPIFVNIENIEIDSKSIGILPKSYCTKYSIIPIKVHNDIKRIDIICKYPLEDIKKEDIKLLTGYDPFLYFVKDANALKKYINNILQENSESLGINNICKTLNNLENLDSPVIKFVNSIFSDAIKFNSSDIHIEPFNNFYKIRFRVDGILREMFNLNKSSYNSVITRIKVLSKIDISEKRLPLDGRITIEENNLYWDLRVSTMPTVHGEKVVIRIFEQVKKRESINDIGLFNENLSVVKNFLKSKSGIIIVSGPTGSGKSTTLYTLIKELDMLGKNIVTIEDPVEQTMDNVVQINVNQSIGFDFAKGLRAILRQDPDVIMVGEIRDKETASIAMGAAITGHLVFSTIHTSNCASVIDRLLDMNVEPYMISAGISGIISQRLLRKICNNCRENYTPNDFEVEILKINKGKFLSKGKGCALCGYTGYYGRIGVFEVMEINNEFREAILKKKGSSIIKNIASKNNMKTLRMSCIELVKNRVTTTKEILNVCNWIV